MGSLLIGLGAILFLEERWTRYFPVFFSTFAAAMILGTRELVGMMPARVRPRLHFCIAVLIVILLANLLVQMGQLLPFVMAFVLIGFFSLEMIRFDGLTDGITARIAMSMLVILYLGLLPSFLVQLRILSDPDGTFPSRSSWSLLLVIAVVKCGDIGAYFTGKFIAGRWLGRHRMTPLLSPQKTWEGALGGLVSSIAIACIIINQSGLLHGSIAYAVGFGFTVGIAGMLGDLAESLIKRDFQTKDASATVPGFGGVLDVVDSLLFAGPVAYLWLQ